MKKRFGIYVGENKYIEMLEMMLPFEILRDYKTHEIENFSRFEIRDDFYETLSNYFKKANIFLPLILVKLS